MCSKNKDNRLLDAIESTLKNLQTIVDVNTIIGSPIKTNNEKTIIPISKVTMAVLAGGGEYGKVTIFNKSSDLPYSAGNGTIVSIKPCGFLVEEKDGFNLLKVEQSIEENLLNKAIDLFSNFNMK